MPTFQQPNESELAWIANNVARATEMARKYGGLDDVWTSFSGALRASGDDPNTVINMVGIAIGQQLVDALGLSWVIATDEYGTELAVYREANNVLVYPCNLVAKRWQSGETNFIEPIVASMIRDIGAL
ncbi:MAG: DUF3806 domain-containing protein [Kofleriaceae bacterium]